MEPSVSVSLTIIRQARRLGSKLFRPNLRPHWEASAVKAAPCPILCVTSVLACDMHSRRWTCEERLQYTLTHCSRDKRQAALVYPATSRLPSGKVTAGKRCSECDTHTHTHGTHTQSRRPAPSQSQSLSAAVEAADPLDWITIFQQRNWNRNSESLHSPTADVAGPTIN